MVDRGRRTVGGDDAPGAPAVPVADMHLIQTWRGGIVVATDENQRLLASAGHNILPINAILVGRGELCATIEPYPPGRESRAVSAVVGIDGTT